MASGDSSWVDGLVENFGSGGKYHNIWESVEDVGRQFRDKTIDKATKSPAQLAADKAKKEDYLATRNNEGQASKPSFLNTQNMLYVGIAAVGGFLLLKGL